MEPTTSHAGHSALDPQSSAPGAEPAARGRALTRPAPSVPRAAAGQAAGVAAAPAAPPASVDIESLVTEDDTPVDNMPSEKQQRLLTEPLYSSWAGPGAGRTFLAAANVGVFPEARNPAIVPDVFLSLDVQVHDNFWDKRHRSYFVWEFGKPPDLVVEIVSNREGNEVGSKRLRYARMGVGYYVIYDPLHRVMREDLRVYRLSDGGYARQQSQRFPELRLGMRLWEGEFEGVRSRWLRWTDEHDVLIPMGKERAERAEHLMAQERRRADRLAALLRRSGIDPEQA
ncbi:MAG: Uma2 family endonuclease [Candidatus Tectomicrobia bacterium]|nr:Uma2 family endonuclease [Candidatus Tectomicrobia bacterium]